jgi:dienelactone hydrolase
MGEHRSTKERRVADDDSLEAFARFDFTDPQGRWTRPVYRRGAGPAVIVIHEMPGLHPLVLRFASRVAAAGMTVFCPNLFGQAGRPVTPLYALGVMAKGICIRREFDVWAADRSSPIVDWLRALARRAHEECGGRGVGAVGMCFTGNFALAMMTESRRWWRRCCRSRRCRWRWGRARPGAAPASAPRQPRSPARGGGWRTRT